MTLKKVIEINGVSDHLLAALESRNVALWVGNQSSLINSANLENFVKFLGLPWKLIFCELSHPSLIKALEESSSIDDSLIRKRGFIQVIDSDPSRNELPQRCLPIYFPNGRSGVASSSGFESGLRRMIMLEELRRSGVQHLLVLSGEQENIPGGLVEIWSSGFRAYTTFVSGSSGLAASVQQWLDKADNVTSANASNLVTPEFLSDFLHKYFAAYTEDQKIIRVRDVEGLVHKLDIAGIDDPERPLLDSYSVILDKDLSLLSPQDLSEEDFVSFFKGNEEWKPYAAGLPWIRDDSCKRRLDKILDNLDDEGAEKNTIAFISSEPGAGATTLARMLAWEYASKGYPVLIAKQVPFVPDAISIGNFLNRVHGKISLKISSDVESAAEASTEGHKSKHADRRYHTPWLLVFDSLHWDFRETELRRFRSEMEKQGRPVCILVITGPALGMSYYDTTVFKPIATLTHSLDRQEAQTLGAHLNKYLSVFGKQRKSSQWDQFFEDHTVKYLGGTSAFWIALSFWIQGQYDLTESIQEWMYKNFNAEVKDEIIREAILDIAALSSERLPLPEGLLPISSGEWPISVRLEDVRSRVAALGLVKISSDTGRYWALAHDILGRYIITALFYDFPAREKLGFGEAKNAEHLRFMLLRRISQKSGLSETDFRSIGEDFATAIFKMDPDRGHGSFSFCWRETLSALDNMPKLLRDTSRVFRHHTSISRRRIVSIGQPIFDIALSEKITLLTKAIEDIRYALENIRYTPGSEPDLNLYNSLANAYLDLRDCEQEAGAPPQRLDEIRKLANDASRKAYEESPTNAYAVETYVKNLLSNARESADLAVDNCIEALGVVFAAITSNDLGYRKVHLGDLADEALKLLLSQAPKNILTSEPQTPVQVLTKAWCALTQGVEYSPEMDLSDFPSENRTNALEVLKHQSGRGNMQVIRLRLQLVSIEAPYEFQQQAELLQELESTDYRFTPQMRLEYAIILYQCGRYPEGDRIFKALRFLWRDSEHFVYVPERLQWLRDIKTGSLKVVHAAQIAEYGNRSMATVQEFNNIQAAYRPLEFDVRAHKAGQKFSCVVSFGRNGPFLRPVTAGPV